nr:hypothetical protein [Tanacetum cinerariifolium]
MGIAKGPVPQSVITHNAAYQADDLDAYDSDCDEMSTAKAVLMANLSRYGLDVLSEEKELLTKTFNVFKNESTEKKAKNIDTKIALEKKVKELDNIVCKMGQSAKAQQIRPMLYDGNVIAKETNVISIADSEETLMLEEKSRSKMLLKQSDPVVLEKKVNTKPSNYAELNRLSKYFDVNTSVKVNSFVIMNNSVNYVEMGNKCLELEAELIKQYNLVERDKYNRLSKRFSKLEQHCISLEIAMQLNKEIFQKTNTSVNQIESSFDQLFKLNNLKPELQAKDTTIKKLKAHIKRINETSTSESVKKDFDEIETINIELEHRVTRLIAKNEHLK